jgi:hypothetical protein
MKREFTQPLDALNVAIARINPTGSELEGVVTRLQATIEFSRKRAQQTEKTWHEAPNGEPCCCTPDDRRYGCGCK